MFDTCPGISPDGKVTSVDGCSSFPQLPTCFQSNWEDINFQNCPALGSILLALKCRVKLLGLQGDQVSANTKHIQILPRVFSCHYLPRKQLLELPQGDSVIMYRKSINQANSLFSCLPSTERSLGTFDLEVRAQDWEVGAQAPLPALPKAHEHLKIIHVTFPVTWFPLCLKRAINAPSPCIKSELLLIITRGLRALDLN